VKPIFDCRPTITSVGFAIKNRLHAKWADQFVASNRQCVRCSDAHWSDFAGRRRSTSVEACRRGMARPERLELPTFWFVVKFAFAISLIRLGSAYSLYSGFPGYSGVNGPILDPTCEV